MQGNLIQFGETLVIKGMTRKSKLLFVFRIIVVLLIIILFLLFNNVQRNSIFLCLIIPMLIALSDFLIPPTTWNDITIVKKEKFLKVNKKGFDYDELLFLRLKEEETYQIVRLEAKRDEILLPNEYVLFTKSKSYGETLAFCRRVRDFIGHDLKINDITMGSPAEIDHEMYTYGGGGRGSGIEIWHYID